MVEYNQAHTQLGKQGAHPSGLAYITRQTSIIPSLKQGRATAQEPVAQGTTTWPLWIFKLLQLLRTTTTRT